jgi:hypothetical protein
LTIFTSHNVPDLQSVRNEAFRSERPQSLLARPQAREQRIYQCCGLFRLRLNKLPDN